MTPAGLRAHDVHTGVLTIDRRGAQARAGAIGHAGAGQQPTSDVLQIVPTGLPF
jgi:hypothetical protein